MKQLLLIAMLSLASINAFSGCLGLERDLNKDKDYRVSFINNIKYNLYKMGYSDYYDSTLKSYELDSTKYQEFINYMCPRLEVLYSCYDSTTTTYLEQNVDFNNCLKIAKLLN